MKYSFCAYWLRWDFREVGRDGRTRLSPEEAQQTIEKYVRLSCTLREVEPGADLAQARSRTVALHTFLSSYTYYFEREDHDAEPVRLIDRVRSNKEFVEGLKGGKLLFAGMELGEGAPA